MKRFITLFALVTTLLTNSTLAAEKTDALQIDLLSFSNGPTYQFIVTDPVAIKDIIDLLGTLPIHPNLKGNDWLYPRDHVGYRGFRVRNLSTSATDFKGFAVFGSNVEVVRHGATSKEFRLDANAEIERRLTGLLEASGRTVTPRVTAEAKQQPGLKVNVLVFSGRPNPTFVVTNPEVIKEITDALKQLPIHPTLRGNDSLTRPGQLGYRGFQIENTSTLATDILSFSIYRSNIELSKSGAIVKEFRVDTAAGIESRLIELAEVQNIMAANVLAHIKDRQ